LQFLPPCNPTSGCELKRIIQAHRGNADSKRLDAIPEFGVILSTAVVATMTDPKAFKTGREFAAWIGLVPRQNSTGGKERLGSIRASPRTCRP
jgi:transposase